MEWTREKTLSLINEYRKRRGLWDMTHEDYRKKEIKHKLLVEASASLGGGIPIVEIEKKFHTLRTQYHREINRIKRKEPYNSKWFGFKNLQFLSSPKACRSTKSRVKSEITEDGIVTKKYIMGETSQDGFCGVLANSTINPNDEYLTLHRKGTGITYADGSNNRTSAASRSNELEKLIEETTKDIDLDEAKPKTEISRSLDHHSYAGQLHTGSSSELSGGEQDPLQQHDDNNSQEDDHLEEDDEPIESIDIQPVEEETAYQCASSTGQAAAVQHHHNMATRIIKIKRRGTCPENDYYEDHQQQAGNQARAMPANPAKRIFFGSNGQQHTATILATSTPNVTAQALNNSTLLTPGTKFAQRVTHGQQLAATPQQTRDEFATYGEYVANEMRGITNRQVLVALKHKINTSLFEASMAELQK